MAVVLSWAMMGLPTQIGGCASSPRALQESEDRRPGLNVLRHVGGANQRILVRDDCWLRTHGGSLLVTDPATGRTTCTLDLAVPALSGTAVDLVAHADRGYAVLRDEAVVELALPRRGLPKVVRRITRAELGIIPRRLSVADDDVFVSGLGGVVRLNDLELVFGCEEEAGRVVMADAGLVTTAGRRVFTIEDHRYLGSATDLQPILPVASGRGLDRSGPDEKVVGRSAAPEARLLFVRQGPSSAAVGLMTGGIRELNAAETTVIVPGQVRQARVIDDRVWIVHGDHVSVYAFSRWRLSLRAYMEIAGVCDLGVIDDSHVVLVGAFGSAVWHLLDDVDGQPGEIRFISRQPGPVRQARFDGRCVLADCENGSWLFNATTGLARPAEFTPLAAIEQEPEPAEELTAVGWGGSITISETGDSAVIRTNNGQSRYVDKDGYALRCVASIAGDIWVGHDRGISVLCLDCPASIEGGGVHQPHEIAALRLADPVRYLFPMPGGSGAVFVCGSGRMGVVECVLRRN